MENNAKILLCDENAEERRRIIDFLSKSGIHNVDEATNGESAIEKISTGSYHIAIVDLWMSGIDGIGIIRSVMASKIKPKPAFILLSPINKQSILVEASEAGADFCLLKPFDNNSLVGHIDSLLRMQSKRQVRDGIATSADMFSGTAITVSPFCLNTTFLVTSSSSPLGSGFSLALLGVLADMDLVSRNSTSDVLRSAEQYCPSPST